MVQDRVVRLLAVAVACAVARLDVHGGAVSIDDSVARGLGRRDPQEKRLSLVCREEKMETVCDRWTQGDAGVGVAEHVVFSS